MVALTSKDEESPQQRHGERLQQLEEGTAKSKAQRQLGGTQKDRRCPSQSAKSRLSTAHMKKVSQQ